MENTHGISGQPLSPKDAALYKQEYKEGAKLFERSLDRYSSSDDKYQKEQFLEVMQKANEVLNQAARALKNHDLEKKNHEIEKDFKAFQQHPGGKTEEKLKNDLKDAYKMAN